MWEAVLCVVSMMVILVVVAVVTMGGVMAVMVVDGRCVWEWRRR